MKVVIALDKFKGSLSAATACRIVRATLAEEHPDWELVVTPMADGGDGTAAALREARGGEWVPVTVTGPFPGHLVQARYVWVPQDATAVVEMAAASGLVLLKPGEQQPLRTTTYGTGELLAAAARHGARRLWLAIGGSATVDGGVGAAMAVGWHFFDGQGKPLGLGGGELIRLARIVPPREAGGRTEVLVLPEIDVLCDVDNPLCGAEGAARMFGPQKGATPAMVEQLEEGLARLAVVVREQLGRDIAEVPGAGAAGGLAAGAMAFFGARLVPGIETVMAVTQLHAALEQADWVITGEGRFDEQSLRGKVVSGVSRLARNCGVPVAVLAGSVDLDAAVYRGAGIERAVACQQGDMSLEYSLAHAGELLAAAAREWARLTVAAGR